MPGLNKPAAERRRDDVRPRPTVAYEEERPPRWYLWEGGFLAIGRADGKVPAHAHHAIQICIALEGKLAIAGAGERRCEGRGIIVRADAEHSFHPQGGLSAMVFVDPESREGAWLQSTLADDITPVPDARVDRCVAALRTFWERPLEAMELGELVRHCVHAMCAGAPPARRIDPRIANVLAAIRQSDDLRMSLEAAAALAHLSPGRFAHLFKDELGLPFRHYMLWRKVARGMIAIGHEPTMAAAAHSADFADAAHLTRTFHRMFGIPPSVMMRGSFFRVPSPFSA